MLTVLLDTVCSAPARPQAFGVYGETGIMQARSRLVNGRSVQVKVRLLRAAAARWSAQLALCQSPEMWSVHTAQDFAMCRAVAKFPAAHSFACIRMCCSCFRSCCLLILPVAVSGMASTITT